MAKNPSDKELSLTFTPREHQCDQGNRKKLAHARVQFLGLAKELREVLPDDMGSLQPILTGLGETFEVAVDVFEKRSGVPVAPRVKAPKAVKAPKTPVVSVPVAPPIQPTINLQDQFRAHGIPPEGQALMNTETPKPPVM